MKVDEALAACIADHPYAGPLTRIGHIGHYRIPTETSRDSRELTELLRHSLGWQTFAHRNLTELNLASLLTTVFWITLKVSRSEPYLLVEGQLVGVSDACMLINVVEAINMSKYTGYLNTAKGIMATYGARSLLWYGS